MSQNHQLEKKDIYEAYMVLLNVLWQRIVQQFNNGFTGDHRII